MVHNCERARKEREIEMINGMYHTVVRNLIIDAAPYGNGYEVMVMKRNGTEVESASAKTEIEAVNIFEDFIRKYDVLTGKYAKLRNDISIACMDARRQALDENDTGSCNFDAACIHLPRWKEKDVIRAAEEAGVTAYKAEGSYYIIHTPRVGMAWRNTVAAQTMTQSLKASGYNVYTRYMMD